MMERRPVLLNNPSGWSNVTRFATLTVAKLSMLEKRVERGSAAGLARAFNKIQRRQMREAFGNLHRNTSLDNFVHARAHAEEMLQRLHSMVDNFDLEVDHLVEDIVQGVLEEDAANCPNAAGHARA